MTRGSHDTREVVDTSNKVAVKRWVWETLFPCCEETFLLWKVLQIPMLQPQTTNRNSKGNDIQAYVAALHEIEYLTALNRAETSKASVQMMTIVI